MPVPTDTYETSFLSLFAIAHRVAHNLLRDKDLAEEVSQEALLRAFVHWDRVASYASPWIARVATNLSLGILRRQRRMPERPEADRSESAPDDIRLDLLSAMSELSERQRQVLYLRHFADLSEAHVARVLDCSISTVKQHARRGLGALRATPSIQLLAESVACSTKEEDGFMNAADLIDLYFARPGQPEGVWRRRVARTDRRLAVG